jgi:hypothetical protein
MGYADRISGLILPPVMGQIIKLWPTHAQAYKSFFLIGGSLTAVSFLIFALAVHPLDEPLGLRLQCTRHLFHRRYDGGCGLWTDGSATASLRRHRTGRANTPWQPAAAGRSIATLGSPAVRRAGFWHPGGETES